MQTIEINPLWIEIGGPALLAGLALGALISWLLSRSKQQHLQEYIKLLEASVKDQDTLQMERDSAFEVARS